MNKKDYQNATPEEIWAILKASAEAAEKHAAEARKQEAKHAKLSEDIDKLYRSTQQHGDYINNASARLEEFFRKAIEHNDYRVGDVVFDDIQANTARRRKKDLAGIEMDGLLLNGTTVGMLEVKSTLHVNDIEKIEAKIPIFRQRFKEYADKQLLVLVAGEIVHDEARKEAHKLGFVVLTPDGQKIAIDDSHQRTY